MKKLLTDIMLELHVPDFELIKKFYSDLGYKSFGRKNLKKGKDIWL